MAKSIASTHLVEIIRAISRSNLKDGEICNRDPTPSKETRELDAITAELAVTLGLGNIRLEGLVCLSRTGTTERTSPQPSISQYWSTVFAAPYNKQTYKRALEIEYGLDPNLPTTNVVVSVLSSIHNIPRAEEALLRILESRYPNRN
jgi:hypothetical protein